jgi:hypothetical protein
MCEARGIVTPATVADHMTPHRGNWNEFLLGKLQSLCSECHDREKQRIEVRGFGSAIGDDGWPLDPNHPANRR